MITISTRRRLALGMGASAMLVAATAGPAFGANERSPHWSPSGVDVAVDEPAPR